ncbi:MAG TPA: hydroxymethylglutaryl-CoA reductase [Pyrinomonadaceae bacterium]|nr:hydroxymethylglutaryl-CoA reductase [Pyrinomonadaceae bacterium]
MSAKIPRNKENDYTHEAAEKRREFVKQQTTAELDHVGSFSFDPSVLPGNIENFIGVAQVPIGLAGPLLVNGEHANGEFFVPLSTTEGTLVASYNRGMKLLKESGGVTVTVVDDAMQRAPAFVFKSAREANKFGEWVKENFDKIKKKAESTTSAGKLRDIQQFPASRFLYLRFNYTTGDAAGQNMVGKATKAACDWIMSVYPEIERYQLEGSMATDKKTSWVNTLHTRGKKVIAEATISKDKLLEIMHISVEKLFEARLTSQLGAYLAGVNNNGAHSANGITAMFIACGQDVANVAESSAAAVYAEVTKSGDYYFSVTIPSLIVATYGGGTSLPTQRECLEMLGCYGKDKVRKFAEIVAATVLCGELSLGSAAIAGDWVSSHEQLGRNR